RGDGYAHSRNSHPATRARRLDPHTAQAAGDVGQDHDHREVTRSLDAIAASNCATSRPGASARITAPITAMPAAPARSTWETLAGVMPPIATTGMSLSVAIAATPLAPRAGP